jgi:NurA domain
VLELNKLTHEVAEMGAALAGRAAEFEQRLPAAQALLNTVGQADEELRAKIEKATNFAWSGAMPTDEPANASYPPPAHPARLNVLAADGSQIYPDRHGLALYYLINIGSIVFRHGLSEAPGVHTEPQVFYEDADLYQDDGGQVPSVLIDVRRDVAELGELARLAALEAAQAPTLAVMDNGLMLFVAPQVPGGREAQRANDDYQTQYLGHMQASRETGAALAGVVDRPHAVNVIRLLCLSRLESGEINQDTLRSLAPFEHITDAVLFNFLEPGERSAVFKNASKTNLDLYAPRGHAVHFFYLNAGRVGQREMLRIEVPEWIAQDTGRLGLVHAAIVEQCRLSAGFPYVLMRAHELAVVTQAERREFDQMVQGALIRQGMSPSVSQKAQGKAWTGAAKRRYGT